MPAWKPSGLRRLELLGNSGRKPRKSLSRSERHGAKLRLARTTSKTCVALCRRIKALTLLMTIAIQTAYYISDQNALKA